MKLLLLACAAAALVAPPLRAQDADAPLGRALSDAAELLVDAPSRIPGARARPDEDEEDADPPDAKEAERPPLGEFHKVADGIFRSALPTAEGYALLRKMGFKTILNLQGSEKKEARRAGPEIHVVQVGMSGYKRPSFKQMDRALDALASAKRPILVHCVHGRDRTGFVIAAYRVTVENVPAATAAQEARSYGCCFVLFGNLAKYLEKYRVHRLALHPIAGVAMKDK